MSWLEDETNVSICEAAKCRTNEFVLENFTCSTTCASGFAVSYFKGFMCLSSADKIGQCKRFVIGAANISSQNFTLCHIYDKNNEAAECKFLTMTGPNEYRCHSACGSGFAYRTNGTDDIKAMRICAESCEYAFLQNGPELICTFCKGSNDVVHVFNETTQLHKCDSICDKAKVVAFEGLRFCHSCAELLQV